MNALPSPAPASGGIALVLLGVGGGGRALLDLLATPAAGALHLVAVADSARQWVSPRGVVPAQARKNNKEKQY